MEDHGGTWVSQRGCDLGGDEEEPYKMVLMDVAIAPEFRIDDTRLEPTGNTYGGVVDYMIIYLTGLLEVLLVQALCSFSQTLFRRYSTVSEVYLSV